MFLTSAQRLQLARDFLALPGEALPSVQDASSSDEAMGSDQAWRLLRAAVADGERSFTATALVPVAAMERLTLRADRDGWRDGRTIRVMA